MKIDRGLSCLFAALLVAARVWSAAEPDGAAALLERLRTLYPASAFTSVRASPVAGLYEVVTGRNVVYVSADGHHFVFGHLVEMRTQRDLTAERQRQLERIDFEALPLADAIKTVRGSGKRALAVFSDPDCPYCRQLEAALAKLEDVTIYTFLFPLEAAHPHARRKAISVWCASASRAQAWQALVLKGETLPDRDCPHPIDRNLALGAKLGIGATPTLISLEGRVRAGAAQLDQLDAWLNATSRTVSQQP